MKYCDEVMQIFPIMYSYADSLHQDPMFQEDKNWQP